jgi:hypothetical protein
MLRLYSASCAAQSAFLSVGAALRRRTSVFAQSGSLKRKTVTDFADNARKCQNQFLIKLSLKK